MWKTQSGPDKKKKNQSKNKEMSVQNNSKLVWLSVVQIVQYLSYDILVI